jgi:hypothetical protein
VQLELIEIKQVSMASGQIMLHKTSASSFLTVGLEIEDVQ